MRLAIVLTAAGAVLTGLAAGQPGSALAQDPEVAPKPQVEATAAPDLESLADRAVASALEGDIDGAIAAAAKGETASDRDAILTAVAEALTAAGEGVAGLDVAVRLDDSEARRALVARIGAAIAGTAAPEAPGEEAPAAEPEVDRGEMVRAVQQALRDLGYDAGPVDGVVGRRTLAAAAAFQQTAGLETEEGVTTALRDALDAAVADETYIRFGTEAALIGLPFTNRLRGALREADIREAGAAFAFGLEALAPGETVTWRSRASGEITLGARFEQEGRPCRRFTHRIRVGEMSETASDLVACKQTSLGWLLVE